MILDQPRSVINLQLASPIVRSDHRRELRILTGCRVRTHTWVFPSRLPIFMSIDRDKCPARTIREHETIVPAVSRKRLDCRSSAGGSQAVHDREIPLFPRGSTTFASDRISLDRGSHKPILSRESLINEIVIDVELS